MSVSHVCKSLRFPILGLVLLALAACAAGDNRITLGYIPSMDASGCQGAVAVASFLDARPDPMLGHNENFQFRPDGQGVDEWLRTSLVQELEARGCRVAEAGAPGAPEVVVAGSVSKARLVAERMNHALELEFTVTLTKGADTVFKKTYAGRWERMIALPSREKSEEMFAVCLHELMVAAVIDLGKHL
ncbi:hypothetical protein [Desulfocurvus sp. DL9XJH121]